VQNKDEDVSFFINQLFPGAHDLYMRDTEKLQPEGVINDLSTIPQEDFDSSNPPSLFFNQSIPKKLQNMRAFGKTKSPDSQARMVMGMVSKMKELFLFEKAVEFGDKPE